MGERHILMRYLDVFDKFGKKKGLPSLLFWSHNWESSFFNHGGHSVMRQQKIEEESMLISLIYFSIGVK